MNLIYLDESGNSGNNLEDPQQRIFLLCAMILPEEKWCELEEKLSKILDQYFPPPRPPRFEIHSVDLHRGSGIFKGVPIAARAKFRDEWMEAGESVGVRLVSQGVEKPAYRKWQTESFGAGVSINPHVAAFAFVSRAVDDYLQSLPDKPRGIFICDENREVMADVEKSIRIFRQAAAGPTKLAQIIEKGFFIDSHKSLPLQLCDLYAYSLRKRVEFEAYGTKRWFDEPAFPLVARLSHRGNASSLDVVDWLKSLRT